MKEQIKINDKTEWFAEELRLAELHEDFMSKYAIECKDNKGAEWYSWKESDSPQDVWEMWIEPKLKQVKVEPEVKPVDYGTCKNCIFNLEQDGNSLVGECQLTIDEFTGIGLQFSSDFGCNQWQSKPSV